MLSGRTTLYLSTRTAWVIPLGAVLATIAAVGRLVTARSARPESLSSREAWVLGLVVLPVVAFMALPGVALDTYAVGRRSSFSGAGISANVRAVSGPLDMVDVAAAETVPAARAGLRARAGEQVTFEGLVSHEPGTPPSEFALTRFIITCCVADATIARVRVVGGPAGGIGQDSWVRVTGRIFPIGTDVLVVASSVEQIPVPDRPYLTP
jgi:uncharacterized repeat protein (TIGR03943 family)